MSDRAKRKRKRYQAQRQHTIEGSAGGRSSTGKVAKVAGKPNRLGGILKKVPKGWRS